MSSCEQQTVATAATRSKEVVEVVSMLYMYVYSKTNHRQVRGAFAHLLPWTAPESAVITCIQAIQVHAKATRPCVHFGVNDFRA